MVFPFIMYADKDNAFFSDSSYAMTMAEGGMDFLPYDADLMEMPDGGIVKSFPSLTAYGFDLSSGSFSALEGFNAVGCRLPTGYLRLYLPSYKGGSADETCTCSAVGVRGESTVVAALQVDKISTVFNNDEVAEISNLLKEKYKNNRLIRHILSLYENVNDNASIDFLCRTGEFIIPIQSYTLCFGDLPSEDDVLEAVHFYSDKSKRFVVSFCCDKPAYDCNRFVNVIKNSFEDVSVNLYIPLENYDSFKHSICRADGIYINMGSFVEKAFLDVNNSACGSLLGAFVENISKYEIDCAFAIDVLPGITDRNDNVEVLSEVINHAGINLLILKNAPVPSAYNEMVKNLPSSELLGVKNMLRVLKKKCKDLQFGYYSRHKCSFYSETGYPDLKIPKFKKRNSL